METKLRAVLAAGLPIRVSEVCAELGISRQTFYKYKRRWAAEGPAGLVERSRRPHHSPRLMPVTLEDEIVRLRKELPLYNGAQSIVYQLKRDGWPVPSVSAAYRALVRRGLVAPQPHKRPRSAWQRFEWPRPNAAWQIDATWVLSSGRELWVMDVLDDHSRLVVAARACGGPTGEAAWDALCDGASRWGIFHDAEVADRYLEIFQVDSWAEHLRQHERLTQADRKLEQRLYSYVLNVPSVRHLIYATNGGGGDAGLSPS